jgi:hypothetical protein
MQHERDYDQRTATPTVRTLDDLMDEAGRKSFDGLIRETAIEALQKADKEQRDSDPSTAQDLIEAVKRFPSIPVLPKPYDPFVDIIKRSRDFADKMWRGLTRQSPRKPTPDDFKI